MCTELLAESDHFEGVVRIRSSYSVVRFRVLILAICSEYQKCFWNLEFGIPIRFKHSSLAWFGLWIWNFWVEV